MNNDPPSNEVYSITETTTTEYRKHRCSSLKNASYSPYSLSQSKIENGTASIIADLPEPTSLDEASTDNRIQRSVYPEYIVKILSDGEFIGTGFIVNNGVIATDAHCIYDIYSGEFFSNVSVILFNANGTVAQEITAKELHIPEGYANPSVVNGSKTDYQYDYGLIYVSQDLSSFPYCDLGTFVNPSRPLVDAVSVTTVGFPLDKKNSAENHSLWSSSGETMRRLNTMANFTASVYASNGQSGSPVYHRTNYKLSGVSYSQDTVIGLLRGPHDDTYVLCKNIDGPVLNFYKNNSHIG